MRLALDHKDEKGNHVKGLWNSLSQVLGQNSFDYANRDVCWNAFHSSGISLGNDHKALISRANERYTSLCQSLDLDHATSGPFASPPGGFGSGSKKLHRDLQDKLRELDKCLLLKKVTEEIPRTDQRAAAFLDTLDDKFANATPLACFADVPVSAIEFRTMIQRKLGLPLTALQLHLNERIQVHGRGKQRINDAFGNQLQLAANAKGGHTYKLHNDIVRLAMQLVSSPASGIFATTNGKNTFSKCLRPGAQHPDESQRRLLQSSIPDGRVDASEFNPPSDTFPANFLIGQKTLVEMKTLARTDRTVHTRAKQVQDEMDRRLRELDELNPGSTFVQTQKGYNNGIYLALVLGSFGQFSPHASDLVDLVAQSRAILMMRYRKIRPQHAYGLCRAPVVSRLGLAGSLGWVRLILDRFRDAVCTHPDSSTPFVNLENDEFNFESLDSQRRGGGGFRNWL